MSCHLISRGSNHSITCEKHIETRYSQMRVRNTQKPDTTGSDTCERQRETIYYPRLLRHKEKPYTCQKQREPALIHMKWFKTSTCSPLDKIDRCELSKFQNQLRRLNKPNWGAQFVARKRLNRTNSRGGTMNISYSGFLSLRTCGTKSIGIHIFWPWMFSVLGKYMEKCIFFNLNYVVDSNGWHLKQCHDNLLPDQTGK